MDRVTVAEAAQILGIKEESVRKRVSRGKLRADKDPDGRLLLYVDGTQTVRDDYGDRSVTDEDEQPDLARELIEEMRLRISSLEYQLSEERESRRRADTIIAQLTQANAALAARVPELEAAESREDASERATEGTPIRARARHHAPYRRTSQLREALVAQTDRRVTTRWNNGASS